MRIVGTAFEKLTVVVMKLNERLEMISENFQAQLYQNFSNSDKCASSFIKGLLVIFFVSLLPKNFQVCVEPEEAGGTDTAVVAIFCILAFTAAMSSSLLFIAQPRAF